MSVSIRHTVSPTMTEEEQKLLRSIGAPLPGLPL